MRERTRARQRARRWIFRLGLWAGLVILGTMTTNAQDLEVVEDLDFDRPEAWAMKYFTSAGLLTSLGPVEERQAGSVDLGFEVLNIPHLSAAERTVGFGGVKEEDLNRSPVWARLRAIVGLPAGFAFTLGVVPPVEVDGVEAALVAAALERPLIRRERWGLGVRLFTQFGSQFGKVDGDLTCSEQDASIPVGAPGNEFGCEAPSSDTVTLEYTGLELVGHHALRGGGDPTLHFGLSAQYLDLEFQVDALTFGFRDRTLLLADGWTYSATFGATWALRQRAKVGLEVFYSPLSVDRLGASPGEFESDNDGLLNLRALFRYRLR